MFSTAAKFAYIIFKATTKLAKDKWTLVHGTNRGHYDRLRHKKVAH